MKLNHVSLIISDLSKSLTFYQDVLDLECDKSRPDLGYPGAWLSLEGNQQIHLLQLPDPDRESQRPQHGGRDRHVAFHVASIKDIIDRLEVRKISYTLSKSGRKAMFCRDPDGNALEFIEQD